MKAGGSEQPEQALVQTVGGTVRGQREKIDDGPSFFNFQGIPYAKPPIGPLRFLPPVPAKPWTNILDATQSSILDSKINRDMKFYWGSEDCLYLDIRTKTVGNKEKIPVMVWIGGTGYSLDFSTKLCSGMMTDENVIFVHISYRVGVFGFLSVGEVAAPGNCGLKDVVMALQWIKKNIGAFGGDADNVTLFGSGSGGSMVHYMMLSPTATGLFHKAIIQSGSALHNWAVTKNPKIATMHLAKELGITCKHPVEVVDILKTIPEIDILKAFSNIVTSRAKIDRFPLCSLFRPCVEEEFEGQTAFITKSPFEIITSGKFNNMPCIMGCNKLEGLLFQKFRLELETNGYDLYSKSLTSLVPSELCVKSAKSENIGLQLMQCYVSGDYLKEETAEHYLKFMSDYYFVYNTNTCVKLHSKFSNEFPLYYYVFDYNGYWGFPEELDMVNMPAHTGELPYVFQLRSVQYKGLRDSMWTRQKVVKLWTNFAKFGNPTPVEKDALLQMTWDPVSDKNALNFLNIGAELTKGCNPFIYRMTFWDNILDDRTFLRICRSFDDTDPK